MTALSAPRPNPAQVLLAHLGSLRTTLACMALLGAAVLAVIFNEADALGLSLRVGALRDSDANRFYLRHGFTQVEETEWDIYYARQPSVCGPCSC